MPSTADITLDQAAGSISGTGFPPNIEVVVYGNFSPAGGSTTITGNTTDATGAFTTGPGNDFCFIPGTTGVQVRVTDIANVTLATEFFELSCGGV